MMTRIKSIILCLLTLAMMGCTETDSINIEFNKQVKAIDQAEKEIEQALAGIAVVDRLAVYRDEDFKLKNGQLRFYADEKNENYSVDQVAKIIMDELAYQPQDIILSVEITENNEEALKALSLEKGQKVMTTLNWDTAEANVYYAEQTIENPSNHLATEYRQNFFCAIKVEMNNSLPSLTYNVSSFFVDLAIEVDNVKTVTGLAIDNESYDIILKGYFVFLIFEHLGDKTISVLDWPGGSAPEDVTKQDCKNMIRTSTNSSLFGLVGHMSATNNVVAVEKVEEVEKN